MGRARAARARGRAAAGAGAISLRSGKVSPRGTAPRRYNTSAAWSASLERSPRISVTWPLCGQPLKRSTT